MDIVIFIYFCLISINNYINDIATVFVNDISHELTLDYNYTSDYAIESANDNGIHALALSFDKPLHVLLKMQLLLSLATRLVMPWLHHDIGYAIGYAGFSK